MNRALSSARDWDLRLPAVVLYAAPLALALFCLTLSQANAFVFWGFEEDEPGTPLSSALMVGCLVIALAAARRSDLPRPMRIVGGVMALIAGLAALDENLLWHEWFGRVIRHDVSSLPRSVTWYTDDVVVVLAAVVGGVIAYSCIRYIFGAMETPARRREVWPYLACTVAIAVTHGLLDILGHGDAMVERLWPGLTEIQVDDYGERISYFEEICKLWAEWFAVLLLLKLLHGRRGPLLWSALVAIGSGMAVMGGLWGVDDPAAGIPCLIVGEPMDYLRNFHSLFALSWVWTAWAAMAWVGLGNESERFELTGTLFLVPLAPVLGALVDVNWLGQAVTSTAHGLMPEAFYGASWIRHGLLFVWMLAPGLGAGVIAGWLIRRWPWAVGILIAVGCALASAWRLPSLAMGALVVLTAVLVVGLLLLSDRYRPAVLVGAVLVLALLAGDARWAVAALGWAVVAAARETDPLPVRHRTVLLVNLAALQLIVCIVVTVATSPVLTPNYEWEPYLPGAFNVFHQPLENPD